MSKKRGLRPGARPWAAWLFVSPLVIGIITYFIYVLVISLQFSFSEISPGETSFASEFIGLSNYHFAVAVDLIFVRRAFYNLLEMLSSIPVILLFSLFVAVLLNQNVPGRTVFRAIFFIPVILVTGLMASADSNNVLLDALSGSGVNTGAEAGATFLSAAAIEEFIAGLNFSPALIGYVTGAIENIIGIISKSGVQILIFLAGLQSIPVSVYEHAKTEGATGWETFWKITLPLIVPMLTVNLFYTVVDFVTGSGNNILSYIRNISFTQGMFGPGSAMAWLYFAAIALIMLTGLLIVKLTLRYQQSNAVSAVTGYRLQRKK